MQRITDNSDPENDSLIFSAVRFGPEHIPAAAELEKICFSDPWSESSLRYLCESDVTYGVAVVCGDRLCAYGGMEYVLDEAAVTNIATAPEFRRRGCARLVLSSLESFAVSHGVKRIRLDVRESNVPARNLYTDCGYAVSGRIRGYYRRPREDAVEMEKTL
ncbi:MAG: ribosomal protein S18-alanine N-acetyltransferase [Clostridia bacterium]|nr:ribosomal protein S18-alanine N-acetyltransferase [Clostridia bacterium]